MNANEEIAQTSDIVLAQDKEKVMLAEYERLKALAMAKFKEKTYAEAIKYYDQAAEVIYPPTTTTASPTTDADTTTTTNCCCRR